MEESFTVSVVGKEWFPRRMHLEEEFGGILYDQLIFVLESIAIEKETNTYSHIRLGVYLDTYNKDTRYLEMSESVIDKFSDCFGHLFHKNLQAFLKRERRKGSELLFQLNSGDLSMSDFEEKTKKDERD